METKDLIPTDKHRSNRKLKRKKSDVNPPHRGVNIYLKSFPVLVIKLLRIVIWWLLSTHIVDCSGELKVKKD